MMRKQNKWFRSLLSFVLAAVMLLSFVPGLSARAASGQTHITIHYYSEPTWGWTPAIQYWGGSSTTVTGHQSGPTEITGWGGAQGYVMTPEGDGWYTITLQGDFTGLQFLNMDNPNEDNNSGGKGYISELAQYTGDTPTDLYCKYNDSLGSYEVIWYTDKACDHLLGSTYISAASGEAVYFSNNKRWETVYAYAWNGSEKPLGEWPGTEMTFVETNGYGEDILTAEINGLAALEGLIFHNNSGAQTVDISGPFVDGTGYYCTDKVDSKWEVGTYEYRKPASGSTTPGGSVSGSASDYFLVGYINREDYTGGTYKFSEDGKLTATFETDSHVYVVNGTGSEEYMTKGYVGGAASATLYNTKTSSFTADKVLVPGGVEVTFTLEKNADGSMTLSYEATLSGVEDTTGIQDGVTLHCWNWSFAEIEKQIPTIASLGYTAIQTSPVQVLKEATNASNQTVESHWWVYYQPVDFFITTDSGNALGTKAELASMVETAHEYGVQVIVDIVVNHLGNKTGNNATGDDRSDKIPDYLLKDEYWHDINKNISDWTDREDMTQNCLSGLPDLNTGNADIQRYALGLLKECIDIGVDGFRFDMAKSIETPKDDPSFASDFWPEVVGGARSYAESQGKDIYVYGEILDDAVIAISAYTEYMSVTDNGWGNHMRMKVVEGTAGLCEGYYKAAPAENLVVWAESHDTYADGSSSGVSEQNINKTWALIAARDGAMALYLARPQTMDQAIGVASVTGWDNVEVAKVNAFHNVFAGQSEVVSNEKGVSYVERGNSGVVLVNVSARVRTVSVTAHAMADGTYVDQISGNLFTVSGGKITGTIGDTGVAVVYNLPQADYTAVEEAIAKIPADLSVYTEASVKALNDAVEAVVEGKRIDEQETVDGYAKAIEDAIAALELKPTDPTDPSEPEDPKPSDPTDPSEPEDTKPSDPTDPSEPEDPKPSDPTDPSEPEESKPTDPTDPSEPEDPKPSDPTDPSAPADPEPENPFVDVKEGKYYYDAVLWAVENGITTGKTETTFEPDEPCTRKQIVTFLWRAAGEPEPESMVNPFVDVKHDRFEKAILWAYYKGITTGTGDGSTFSPDAPCTRKQIVTFLWRFNGEPEAKTTVNPFTDVKADRFENAILWAYENGITTGKSATTFQPEVTCTRCQIVTFLYRSLAEK